MKKRMLEGVLAAIGIIALSGAGPASAQNTASFPSRDPSYKVWMARAMDQCTPGGTSVVGTSPDDPSVGCLQANVVTDDQTNPLGATMNYGFLSVKATSGSLFNGSVHFFGAGFQQFQRVKVQLTLRSTRTGIHVKHPPGSNKRVTFQDTTITCGVGAGGCWPARPNGSIAGTQSLSDCLAQNGDKKNLRLGNVQILDSALINCDTGKVIGTPGIRQVQRGLR